MSDEGFYRRWSKRKTETRQEPKAARSFAVLEDPPDLNLPSDLPPEDEETPKEVVATPAPGPDVPDVEAIDPEANLPDIEQLDYDSDYRGFLSEGVSEELRNRALRRLWRSNPLLANLDGLNDYDDDFTDAAMVLPVLKTAFDAVRGYAPPPEEEGQEPTDSTVPATDSAAETEGKDPGTSEEEPPRLSGEDEKPEGSDQV